MSTSNAELFPWRPEYSVGMADIDSQHKRLIRLMNNLHASMADGKANDVLAAILDDLVRYTVHHFDCEERMMQKKGYAGLMEHREEHRRLARQVDELRSKFRAGSITLSIETMQLLREWLRHHILGSDLLYARSPGFTGLKTPRPHLVS